MHAPTSALKCILHYIQGTKHYGLQLTKSDPQVRTPIVPLLVICVYLVDNLISCSSKHQSVLFRSIAEAEYKGLLMLLQNLVGYEIFFLNFTALFKKPHLSIVTTPVPSISPLTPHGIIEQSILKLTFTLIVEKISRGQVNVLYVPSRHQLADIFTKASHGFSLEIFVPISASDLLSLQLRGSIIIYTYY